MATGSEYRIIYSTVGRHSFIAPGITIRGGIKSAHLKDFFKLNPSEGVPEAFMERLSRMLALEAISSIRGGGISPYPVRRIALYRKISWYMDRSVLTLYPYGILHRTSPDGTPYAPLKERTLTVFRKIKSINRGSDYILRETDKHILNGLRVLKNSSAGFEIGYKDNESKRIAAINHFGDNNTPARPFMGLQDAYFINAAEFFAALIRYLLKAKK